MTTCISLAAFDTDKLEGKLTVRFAQKGEKFLGIGMDAPASLNGGEVIMTDSNRLVAVYPYRDADYSKISTKTCDLTLISCGVPQISIDQLKEAADRASEYIVRYCF
jgi:DNA/RNA-binding domain of Phe-tRNA-synthetase-like protein